VALQPRVQLSVAAALDALAYDFTVFDIDDFLRHIAQHRQRPLSVHTVPLAPELFGFWYPTRETDFIAINATLHHVHQLHTLLHELAHMLLGHRGMDLRMLLGEDLVRQLNIGHTDGHLRSAGMADQTGNPQEREAEQFVLAIRQKLVAARRLQELYGEPTSIRSMQPYVRGLDFNS
jgi:hypothetical protein